MVLFWKTSKDPVVERNVILNCARGIGFGLAPEGGHRKYQDMPGSRPKRGRRTHRRRHPRQCHHRRHREILRHGHRSGAGMECRRRGQHRLLIRRDILLDRQPFPEFEPDREGQSGQAGHDRPGRRQANLRNNKTLIEPIPAAGLASVFSPFFYTRALEEFFLRAFPRCCRKKETGPNSPTVPLAAFGLSDSCKPVCPVWCAEPQSKLNPSSEVAEASAKPQVRVEFPSQIRKAGGPALRIFWAPSVFTSPS